MRTQPRASRLSQFSMFYLAWGALTLLLLNACLGPQVSQSETQITVSVTADGATEQVSIPADSTVSDALGAAGILLGSQDRVEPQGFASLQNGDQVRVVRVREEFEIITEPIPFQSQVVRNESLPETESLLIQPGKNGEREITIRRVYEDGRETLQAEVKQTILSLPQPEITMVGAQNPFVPLPLAGRLAYLLGGNAWVMEGSTGNRRALVGTGDLDGCIFSLSPKGDWLLFTRRSTVAGAVEEINTLWVVNVTQPNARPINLRVSNVVHYASWVPNSAASVAYSTVEPRAQAPGWQANNDLYFLKFGANGVVGQPAKILESNSGGIYGWWGTQFTWSPDGIRLAYSRPDQVGLVSLENKTLVPLLDITPLKARDNAAFGAAQTGGCPLPQNLPATDNWTLIPGLTWGADGRTLFVVNHAPPPALVDAEQSPYFDVYAYSLANPAEATLVRQAGMFAYPAASPVRIEGSEKSYLVAYLQAIQKEQSATSRYRLVVMDRDGSDQRMLFPPEGSLGMEPQTPVWAPRPLSAEEGDFIAVVYQGNLWLIDVATSQARQVTGEGQIIRIDWR